MADCSLRAMEIISSCPLSATAGSVGSATLADMATTGRVRSAPSARTARGASTSIQATPTCTTAAAAAVYLCGQCVLRVRTNLFVPLQAKTGKGAEAVGRCACGASCPAPLGCFCAKPEKKSQPTKFALQRLNCILKTTMNASTIVKAVMVIVTSHCRITTSPYSYSQTRSNPCPSASSSKAMRGRKSAESWLPVRLRPCPRGR